MDYVADINELNNYKINDYKQINKKNLGKKLKSVRINNNHLEKDISKILGIDVSTYSRYENGLYTIQTEYIIAFAKYYNVSLD